jgi:hypothetical protein
VWEALPVEKKQIMVTEIADHII